MNNIITIHNNPENLKPAKGFRHLQIQLADLDTENISKHFSSSFDFIEQARSKGEGKSLLCGAEGWLCVRCFEACRLLRGKQTADACTLQQHCLVGSTGQDQTSACLSCSPAEERP